MVRPVQTVPPATFDRYTDLGAAERADAVDACRTLTDAVYEGTQISAHLLPSAHERAIEQLTAVFEEVAAT